MLWFPEFVLNCVFVNSKMLYCRVFLQGDNMLAPAFLICFAFHLLGMSGNLLHILADINVYLYLQ